MAPHLLGFQRGVNETILLSLSPISTGNKGSESAALLLSLITPWGMSAFSLTELTGLARVQLRI